MRLQFHPRHLEDLRRSGLTDGTIQAAGLYSVPPANIDRKLGRMGAKVMSAYAIPYPGCDGFERYRCFYEEGRNGPKYLQPPGTANHLYIPPGVDLTGTGSLLVTEGEKKALKLVQEGFSAVALGGVWNWLEKGNGYRPAGTRPIADLDKVRWVSRPVCIVFDSDAHVNEKVRLAAFRLARELAYRGARVSLLLLPPGPGGEKVGADDFLVAHGPEAFRELLQTAWSFNPAWRDPEAEVWWRLRELGPDSPISEKLRRLSVLVPVLARMGQTEAAALLEEIRARLKLRQADLTALRGDLKKVRAVAAKAKGQPPALEDLQEAAILHPALDFVVDHMALGFRLTLPEGNDGILLLVSNGRKVEAIVNPDGVSIGGLGYRIGKGAPPFLRDVWSLEALKDFLKCPSPPGDLYPRLRGALQRYLDMPEPAIGLMAAWGLATYFTHMFAAVPYLHFFGPKETGKSKSLEALRFLSFNAWKGRDITVAALGDVLEYQRGTVLIDQAEELSHEGNERLVGLLADGYKKTGGRRRVVEITKAGRAVLEFSTYGPKAFASTKPLHPDLADRCVRIAMTRTRKRLPDLEGWEPEWAELRDACYRFALTRFQEVAQAYAALPGDSTRLNELWRPLGAVLTVLEVPDDEVAAVHQCFLAGAAETRHEPSPWEAALMMCLRDRAVNASGLFTMTASEIIEAMGLDGDKRPTSAWVGQAVSLYGLALRVERRWETGPGGRRSTRLYTFEPAQVIKCVEIYLREGGETAGAAGVDDNYQAILDSYVAPAKNPAPVTTGAHQCAPTCTGDGEMVGERQYFDITGKFYRAPAAPANPRDDSDKKIPIRIEAGEI